MCFHTINFVFTQYCSVSNNLLTSSTFVSNTKIRSKMFSYIHLPIKRKSVTPIILSPVKHSKKIYSEKRLYRKKGARITWQISVNFLTFFFLFNFYKGFSLHTFYLHHGTFHGIHKKNNYKILFSTFKYLKIFFRITDLFYCYLVGCGYIQRIFFNSFL